MRETSAASHQYRKIDHLPHGVLRGTAKVLHADQHTVERGSRRRRGGMRQDSNLAGNRRKHLGE